MRLQKLKLERASLHAGAEPGVDPARERLDLLSNVGIQHLELQISPDGAQNQVVISPIDCVHDASVRYQMLSTGHATLEMVGFDVNGRQLVSGSVRADIEKMIPIVPATLDLH